MRRALIQILLFVALALPIAAIALSGFGVSSFAAACQRGLVWGLESVGWVLIPQIGLGLAIASLALERVSRRVAGLATERLPRWIDPAVESALLLGLLGTISGMVRGFVGVTPDEIQPGPLVNSLGAALRSSGVGFGIALVGVWLKQEPLTEGEEVRATTYQGGSA